MKNCRRKVFPNHNWEQWFMFHTGELTKGDGVSGWLFMQKRVCGKCGLTQIEERKVDISRC